MESKKFLTEKLEKLSNEFPLLNIEYFFDNFDNDHFVFVSPFDIFKEKAYKKAIEIDLEFIDKYPSESVSFIEPDEDLEFDELVYENKPKLIHYQSHININDVFLFENLLDLFPTSNECCNSYYHFNKNERIETKIDVFDLIKKPSIRIDELDEEYALAA